MKPTLRHTVPVLAAAGLLVVGSAAAAQATGHSILGGRHNDTTARTTIHRTTSGPALALQTRSGHAPLAVTSDTKVAHLNADEVDGFSASSLQTRVTRFSLPAFDGVRSLAVSFPGLAPGSYLVTMSLAAFTDEDTEGTPVGSACGFFAGDNFTLLANGVDFGDSDSRTFNGSGVLDSRELDGLFCASQFGTMAMAPSQVTFTRVDAVTPKVADVDDEPVNLTKQLR